HHVVCTREGGMTAEHLVSRGVPVHVLTTGGSRVGQFRALVRELARKKLPVIIHCHGLFSVSTEAALGRFSGASGLVVHVHNLVPPLSPLQRMKKVVLGPMVDTFIAVSQDVEASLHSRNFAPIATVRNATDLSRWAFHEVPDKRGLHLPANAFVLGMIGRIVQRKGFDLFLDVIAGSEAVYGIIVGEGEYGETVSRKIREMGLEERIRCFPFDTDLLKYYGMLDALFLHSTHEGLPLVLLESQAVGVPYLGNAVGGVGEVVKDGENGYLLEGDDLNVIYSRIESIRKNSKAMRLMCRKKIEAGFALSEQVQQIEAIYESCFPGGAPEQKSKAVRRET
ncbi:MAG: glycosyltransferase family 4 protein, partial [bacterium]|nr:glycosyltransferase family 4 protein [bacterium]